MQNQVAAVPAVLTVELDLDVVAQGQRPPEPLSSEAADSLCWAIADDLQRILGPLNDYGFVLLGGLYDLTEILRPGLPMVDVLSELYRRSLPDTRFQPQVMAIGADGDAFPIPEIAPRRRPGSGPLLAIPFLFLGEPENMDALGTKLEKNLLEKGRASLKTGQLVQDRFGIKALNLSFATFNDLCALMKIQLEHAEFGPLWTLLEAALFTSQPPARVELPEGNLLLVDGAQGFARFLTFSQWATENPGVTDPAAAYGRFQQIQRQYTAGLAAHGLSVQVVEDSADLRDDNLDQALSAARMGAMPAETLEVNEVVTDTGDWSDVAGISLTEHSRPGLGPVAYTVLVRSADDRVIHYANHYPLAPEGIQHIRAQWQDTAARYGLDLEFLQPGDILHNANGDQLLPWPEAMGANH
ncbi:hypothetical protein [Aquisalimonas asiatica]|uniref:Uncharacterized protein n=1 Tax=Aquisalimonas asiatica TaxID=406100 RepID=A0A1H8PMT7_9GAMM|nr:hypothetical protein [Aquisalimonas asiatica]SEO43292.1 hypothetical protein SAMN04488052_10153 [Aquisalimonas asiatica]